jgi:DNA-binding transcriptional MerR regulator
MKDTTTTRTKKKKNGRKHPTTADGPLLTRTGAARILRCDVSTIRRWEGKTLHPMIGQRKIRYFKPDDVLALARALGIEPEEGSAATAVERLSGEVSSRILTLMTEGHSDAEIAILVKENPWRIARFRKEFAGQLRKLRQYARDEQREKLEREKAEFERQLDAEFAAKTA